MIDFSDLILQVANNISTLVPPVAQLQAPPPDNIIATTGQVEQVADQTTNAILGTVGAVSAAITGVFVKNQRDVSKNKQSIKATDISLAEYIALEALEDKYALQNPTMSRAEILKLPAYPDEPAITMTLAEARAKERKEWSDDINALYYNKS